MNDIFRGQPLVEALYHLLPVIFTLGVLIAPDLDPVALCGSQKIAERYVCERIEDLSDLISPVAYSLISVDEAVNEGLLILIRTAFIDRDHRRHLHHPKKPRENHAFADRHQIFGKDLAIIDREFTRASYTLCLGTEDSLGIDYDRAFGSAQDIIPVHITASKSIEDGGQASEFRVVSLFLLVTSGDLLNNLFLESESVAFYLLRDHPEQDLINLSEEIRTPAVSRFVIDPSSFGRINTGNSISVKMLITRIRCLRNVSGIHAAVECTADQFPILFKSLFHSSMWL